MVITRIVLRSVKPSASLYKSIKRHAMSAQCSAQVLSGQWGYLTDRILCPCERCRTIPTDSETETFLPRVIIKSVNKMLFAESLLLLGT